MWRDVTIACVLTATCGAAVASGNVDPALIAETDNAYGRLVDWVRRFDMPPPDDPAAALAVDERGSAACVVLRRRGRVLGIGIDGTAGPGLVRRAAGKALATLLGDPTVRSLPDERRAGIGRMLTVELEVAGPLEPMAGRTFDAVAAKLEPGRDGIAARRGERWAYRFPSQMLASGTANRLDGALAALAVDLNLPATSLAALRRDGLQLYRFHSVHMAQSGPDQPSFVAVRGERPVALAAVTPEAGRVVAEGLVDHLVLRLWTGEAPLGMLGDYDAISDRYDPLVATPRDQALTAFALLRHARLPGLRPDRAERASATALILLSHLRAVDEGEESPFLDPGACAGLVYALSEPGVPPGPAVDDLRAAALRAVELALDATERRSPHEHALIAGALARTARDTPNEATIATARLALDRAWASIDGAARLSLLPWIALGERDLAAASGDPSARAGDLAALAVGASRLQLRPGSIVAPTPARDLIGGFVVSSRRVPLADAQSLRILAGLPALAAMDAGGAAALRPAIAAGLRFLIQLAVTPDDRGSYANVSRARGGILAATWDRRLPAAAQALGLLAVTEAVAILEETPETADGPPDPPHGPEGVPGSLSGNR